MTVSKRWSVPVVSVVLIEELVRPHVLDKDLEDGYGQVAQDEEREQETLEWSEATIGDVGDERRARTGG